MGVFRDHVAASAHGLGVDISGEQMDRLEMLKDLLVMANREVNLTAITDEVGIAVKHVADSLTCLAILGNRSFPSFVDIGTGAGFPGLVLKIMREDAEALLIDSVGKKIRFVDMAARELGLIGIRAVHARAEDLGRDPEHREKYWLAVSRGVSKLAAVAEYGFPFIKVGGVFMAMKGPKVMEELEAGGRAATALGGGPLQLERVSLPFDSGERVIVVVQKHNRTSTVYPRKPAVIDKSPLGG